MFKMPVVALISVSLFFLSFFVSSKVIDAFQKTPVAKPANNVVVAAVQPTIEIWPTPTASPSPTLTPTLLPTMAPTFAPTAAPVVGSAPKGYVRIMPLGDSITHGDLIPGAYRTDLWNLLQGDGDKVDFVGLQSTGPYNLADWDHEGHVGATISQIDGGVTGWIRANPPDIILLHIGTNDVLANTPASTMTQNLSKLIGDIFAAKPDTYVIVSTLISLPNGNGSIWSEYNASIPSVVSQYRSQGRKIISVDMSSALSPGDFRDGIHPNYSGNNKMAYMWYPAISTIYREFQPK